MEYEPLSSEPLGVFDTILGPPFDRIVMDFLGKEWCFCFKLVSKKANELTMKHWPSATPHGAKDSWVTRRGTFLMTAKLCEYAVNEMGLDVQNTFSYSKRWLGRMCDVAARYGFLEGMKWLRHPDQNCAWGPFTLMAAAQNNHLHLIQWARSQDPPCPWDDNVCSAAVSNLPILKWLRAQDPPCPWSCWTCYQAIMHDRFETLQWLRDQFPPCPWNQDCSFVAVRDSGTRSGFKYLSYLLAGPNPCPCDSWTSFICATESSTTEYGDGLKKLKLLRSVGCPWNKKHILNSPMVDRAIKYWVRDQPDDDDKA